MVRTSTAPPLDPPRRAAALPPDERRAAIVQATLPLLLAHGEMVTTRQIADAAGIAEGTIFRAFPDKESLIVAVVDAALDPAPLDRALAAIDVELPLADAVLAAVEILQRRVVDVWRVASSVGTRFHERTKRTMSVSPPLVALFEAHRGELTVAPELAARMLRALTMALTHPMLTDRPTKSAEVVSLFLNGVGAGRSSC